MSRLLSLRWFEMTSQFVNNFIPLKCGKFVVFAEVRTVVANCTKDTKEWGLFSITCKEETITLLRTLAEARIEDYIQFLKKRAARQTNRNPKEATRSKPSTSIGQHVQVESYFIKRFLKLTCLTARPRGKRYISFSVFPEQLIARVSILEKEKPTVTLPHDIKEFVHEESPLRSRPGMDDLRSKYFANGPARNAAFLTKSAQRRQSKLHTMVKRFDFRNAKSKIAQPADTGVQDVHTCKVSSPCAKFPETRNVDVGPSGEEKSFPEISTSEQQSAAVKGNRRDSQTDCAREREHPCIQDVPAPREDRSNAKSCVLKSSVVNKLSRKRQRNNYVKHFHGGSVDHQYPAVVVNKRPHDEKKQEHLPHVGNSHLQSHSSEDVGTDCVSAEHRHPGPQDADVFMCKKDCTTGDVPTINSQAMTGPQELALVNGRAVHNCVGVQCPSVTGACGKGTVGNYAKSKKITEVHSSSLEGDDLDICSRPLRIRLRNRIRLQQSGILGKPNAGNGEVIDLTSIGS
uniref:protein SLX4IP isoform X1 n=2 Tax=Myxine glutinosa TaxID=7769 RepID=UPI00358DFF75